MHARKWIAAGASAAAAAGIAYGVTQVAGATPQTSNARQAGVVAGGDGYPTPAKDAAPKNPQPYITSCPESLPAKDSIHKPTGGIKGLNVGLQTEATLVYRGKIYALVSGYEGQDPSQGVIVITSVVPVDPCADDNPISFFVGRTPHRYGAVTITSIDASTVHFSTQKGTTGSFDVETRSFTTSPP